MSVASILRVESLTQSFPSGDRLLTVLHNVSFSLLEGSTSAIVGPSGSGKTTLLSLCAGLDQPTSGGVILDGIDLGKLDEEALARIRNRLIGFVFQTFQLIPTLTAQENVMVPLELRGERKVAGRARDLLSRVGLGDRLHHYPAQLSGGEQQRVAIARAFIHQPKILFADEPTGNLDAETSETVENILFSLNEDSGTTLVVVTHNLELAQRTQRIIHLRGGTILRDASEDRLSKSLKP